MVRIQSRYGQTPHSKNKLGMRSSDLADRVGPSLRTIMIIAHNLANDAMHRSADLVGIPSLSR
jgi:hypothetical protein